MTDTTSPWALAWEMTHKQATGSPATLLQGYNIYLAGGVPASLDSQPGQISAVITPRHGEPTRATIHIVPLTREEQQALAAALTRSRHKGALLKGQLPAALADPAHTGDVPIAPSAAQMTFACDCQQAPCQHTAALGHAVAQRLHTSPSLMTTLRGLPHRHLIALLQAPYPTAAAAAPEKHDRSRTPPRPAGPYIAAHQAYQNWDNSAPPLPSREAAAGGDASTASFAAMELPEPPAPAPSLQMLRHLATEAARQAQQLLTDDTLLETDPVTDAVRLTASLPTGERAEIVAHRLDMEPQAFRRLLKTYALAGAPGLHATRHPYPDDPQVLQQAAAAIAPLRPDSAAPLTTADNRVTDPTADLEIRHGHDGRWYPFAAAGHDWQLIALPHDDPASAYQNALTALHARTRPRR
ncbi:hypothetical protein AB0F17_54310 [Nonomuraea sp. NPDC026600]|uniref:hypothetical protein n=1 Tax=Nonomuraea sp. NPDC026600 TaxID=3155363 RepID=UPI0033F2F43A